MTASWSPPADMISSMSFEYSCRWCFSFSGAGECSVGA